MKNFRSIAVILLAIVAGVYLILALSDNLHLLKAIRTTYLIGSTGPNLDDYKRFDYHLLKPGGQPWPKSMDYNNYVLDKMILDSMIQLETKAFLVVKNDSLIWEKYFDGYDSATVSNSFSVAKTITAIIAGISIKDGFLDSDTDYVTKYLPELKGPYARQIRLRHLLQMSSGIDFEESYDNPFGYMAKVYYGKDVRKRTLHYQSSMPPGRHFFYTGGNTLLISFIVSNQIKKNISGYFEEKVWSKIAEHEAYWMIDNRGDEKSYCCFHATARDFAKIGKLLMDSLKIDNETIVPRGYFQQMITPCMTIDSYGDPVDYYGYQIWLMKYKNQEIFYARGIKGQYIFVIPKQKTIIVRLGNKRSSKRIGKIPDDILLWLNVGFEITGL